MDEPENVDQVEQELERKRKRQREYRNKRYAEDAEYRERELQKRKEYQRKRYAEDAEYRERQIALACIRQRRKRRNEPHNPIECAEYSKQLSIFDGSDRELPATRGDCPTFRPCPYYTCRYNLQTTVHKYTCRIKEQHDSCALDIADKGEHTLEEVGEYMGITRERVRQIEEMALHKLRTGLAHMQNECDNDDCYPWRYWKNQR